MPLEAPAPQQFPLEKLIALREQVSQLAPEIKSRITSRYEPVERLNQLNYLLEAEFEAVWAMLHTPAHLLQRDQEGEGEQVDQIPVSGTEAQASSSGFDSTRADTEAGAEQIPAAETNVKLEFYKEVLEGVSDVILNESLVQKPSVSQLIMPLIVFG